MNLSTRSYFGVNYSTKIAIAIIGRGRLHTILGWFIKLNSRRLGRHLFRALNLSQVKWAQLRPLVSNIQCCNCTAIFLITTHIYRSGDRLICHIWPHTTGYIWDARHACTAPADPPLLPILVVICTIGTKGAIVVSDCAIFATSFIPTMSPSRNSLRIDFCYRYCGKCRDSRGRTFLAIKLGRNQ